MNHENGVREAQCRSIELPLAIMSTTVAIVAMVCVTVIASYIDRGAQQSITPKNCLTPTLSVDSVSPPMSSFGAAAQKDMLDDINKKIKEAEIIHPLNPFPSYEIEDILPPSNMKQKATPPEQSEQNWLDGI